MQITQKNKTTRLYMTKDGCKTNQNIPELKRSQTFTIFSSDRPAKNRFLLTFNLTRFVLCVSSVFLLLHCQGGGDKAKVLRKKVQVYFLHSHIDRK